MNLTIALHLFTHNMYARMRCSLVQFDKLNILYFNNVFCVCVSNNRSMTIEILFIYLCFFFVELSILMTGVKEKTRICSNNDNNSILT